MITILIEFFDKKTKFIADEKKVECPDDIVFAAAQKDEFTGDELSIATASGQQIDYINCRPFAVSEEMRAYIVENHPELKEKFSNYLYSFIGRHGLGPEYD